MAVRVKVEEGYQITVPATVREQLHLRQGDILVVEVHDGYALLMPEPSDYARQLRGLHREVWEDVDPQDYVRREREAWKD